MICIPVQPPLSARPLRPPHAASRPAGRPAGRPATHPPTHPPTQPNHPPFPTSPTSYTSPTPPTSPTSRNGQTRLPAGSLTPHHPSKNTHLKNLGTVFARGCTALYGLYTGFCSKNTHLKNLCTGYARICFVRIANNTHVQRKTCLCAPQDTMKQYGRDVFIHRMQMLESQLYVNQEVARV